MEHENKQGIGNENYNSQGTYDEDIVMKVDTQ